MRSLNQPGNISDHESFSLLVADDAEIRDQSRKWIVGNFWTGGGDGSDKGRLAGIGQANNSHIGHQFKLDGEFSLLAGKAGLSIARTAVDRGNKMGVAFAAFAASCNDTPRSGACEIRQHLSGSCVTNHRSYRNGNHSILSPFSILVFAPAMLPSASPILFLVAEIEQCYELRIRDHHDIAAVTAITAVWSSPRHIFFSPEAHTPPPTITGFDLYPNFIDKFHGLTKLIIAFPGTKKKPRKGPFFLAPQRR